MMVTAIAAMAVLPSACVNVLPERFSVPWAMTAALRTGANAHMIMSAMTVTPAPTMFVREGFALIQRIVIIAMITTVVPRVIFAVIEHAQGGRFNVRDPA